MYFFIHSWGLLTPTKYSLILSQNATVDRCHPAYNHRQTRRLSRLWVAPGRLSECWQNMIGSVVIDEEFKANFRLDRESFDLLVDKLKPRIAQDTRLFRVNSLNAAKTVAVTLYYLKHSGSLRMVANKFGISKPTGSVSIVRVCNAINKILRPHHLKFSSIQAVIDSF